VKNPRRGEPEKHSGRDEMNKLNLAGVKKTVIVRGIITLIAAVNIICGYLGWHLIPLTNTDVGAVVDGGIVIATAAIWAWGWWKNNSFTNNAQLADELLGHLNDGTATITEVKP
jgi:SPP1 family holin